MKKKKLIVWISSLVFVVGLLVLLSFTAFSLKSVEIDFRTSHPHTNATEEEIIENADIQLGGSVFFRNKNKIKANIEGTYPYLKVINIETIFPSKFVIHIAERQEVYAVEYSGGHYICDENLRVLRTSDSFVNTQSNAMLLDVWQVSDLYVPGDYLPENLNPMLYQNMFENNRTLGQQKEIIQKIALTTRYDVDLKKEVDAVTLSLFGGQTVTFANYQVDLSYKTFLFVEAYSNLFDMAGKESKQEDGSMATLTAENLKTCEIYINNYHVYEGQEQISYFKIFVAPSV